MLISRTRCFQPTLEQGFGGDWHKFATHDRWQPEELRDTFLAMYGGEVVAENMAPGMRLSYGHDVYRSQVFYYTAEPILERLPDDTHSRVVGVVVVDSEDRYNRWRKVLVEDNEPPRASSS